MGILNIRKQPAAKNHAQKILKGKTRLAIAIDNAHGIHPNVDFAELERRYDGTATIIVLQTTDAYYAWNSAMPDGYRLGHGDAQLYRDQGHEYIPSGQDILDSLKQWGVGQNRNAKDIDMQLQALRKENRTLKDKANTYKAQAERLEAQTPNPDNWATDWRQRMDLLIKYMWLNAIPATEKPDRPLPEHWEYEDTFERLPQTASVFEIAETCMRVLAGLDREGMMGVHRIKGGKHGRVQHDGHDVLRASIADGRPSAPRLHYIRRDDGIIAFIDASVHDDFLD